MESPTSQQRQLFQNFYQTVTERIAEIKLKLSEVENILTTSKSSSDIKDANTKKLRLLEVLDSNEVILELLKKNVHNRIH